MNTETRRRMSPDEMEIIARTTVHSFLDEGTTVVIQDPRTCVYPNGTTEIFFATEELNATREYRLAQMRFLCYDLAAQVCGYTGTTCLDMMSFLEVNTLVRFCLGLSDAYAFIRKNADFGHFFDADGRFMLWRSAVRNAREESQLQIPYLYKQKNGVFAIGWCSALKPLNKKCCLTLLVL